MEFWGVEVKAGEPLKVRPEPSFVIHLSQACLGETKKDKGSDSILLNLNVGDQKFVLGHLSSEKSPQLSFDLVFEKEFELSHNWKNGSVHFCGYQTQYGAEDDDEFSDLDDSEEEEDVVPAAVSAENGKAKPATANSNAAKPESSGKPKVKVVEPSKDEDDEDSDEDDDDSDDDEDSEDESDDEDMIEADSDDDEDSDEEEDEETPKKAEPSKKRANASAEKTPVSAKKAKADSAQKSGGKKGAHTATPHPAKNAGKIHGTADKSKAAQTPKSGGQFSCKSCSKSFGSDNALQSHSKAKHGGS